MAWYRQATSHCLSLCWPGTLSPYRFTTLRWRHNDHAGVSNHQPHGCLLNRLFRRKSKKTSKLRVTGLCAGNSISRTNGQLRGKCFHLMTSSWGGNGLKIAEWDLGISWSVVFQMSIPAQNNALAWCRHQMETFSVLLALCEGNHRWPVDSPDRGQWRAALVFSIICAWISGGIKQSRRRLFDTSSRSLWRHCDGNVVIGKVCTRHCQQPRWVNSRRTT